MLAHLALAPLADSAAHLLATEQLHERCFRQSAEDGAQRGSELSVEAGPLMRRVEEQQHEQQLLP